MKTKKFITRVVLLLLIVTGCLTFRSIQAAGNNSIMFTFELPPKQEGAYDEGDQLEDVLVYDLYYIAPIKWDGAGDGTNPESTKYYIPSGDIVTSYQSAFPASFKDTDGNINVSERETSPDSGVYELVNTALKDYTLPELANDLARIVYNNSITPNTTDPDTNDRANLPFVNKNTGIEDGLYLALVHVDGDSNYLKKKTVKVPVTGSDTYTEKDVYYTAANSIYHEYDFNPLLVFLKSTDGKAELKGAPKYEENPRYDDLLIVKELTSIGGKGITEDTFSFEPVTFVYEITAYDPKDGKTVIYQDVAAITIGSDEQLIGQTIVERIPVGARVEVKEIYDRSYKLDGTNNPLETTIIVSARDEKGNHLKDDTTDLYLYQDDKGTIFAYTYFKNKFDFDPLEGYGFDNVFRYGSEGWKYDGNKICNVVEPGEGGNER